MEATGGIDLVGSVYEKLIVILRELVGDDDSSIRRILRHKFKELLLHGYIDEVPRYNSGAKKPDHGELPLHQVPIHFLSDRNHRVRSIVKELFVLCES